MGIYKLRGLVLRVSKDSLLFIKSRGSRREVL
jgi:hypothetical protein